MESSDPIGNLGSDAGLNSIITNGPQYHYGSVEPIGTGGNLLAAIIQEALNPTFSPAGPEVGPLGALATVATDAATYHPFTRYASYLNVDLGAT